MFRVREEFNKKWGVLFLTNNIATFELVYWLQSRQKTTVFSNPITLSDIERIAPDFVVSYGYRHIVPADVIDKMAGRIINLHISYLPWNRGANPNFWSFIDDTPKGVTIHEMSEGLDKGKILCQKELFFDENEETFESSYKKLQEEIVRLFKENWEDIYQGEINPYSQVGEGSYHSVKQFEEFLRKTDFSWNNNIQLFLDEYKGYEVQ